MDKPDQQQHGNFVAFLNRRKQPGDKLPMFEDRIAIPGEETQHRMALWAHEYANPADGTVHVMYNGAIDAVASGASVGDVTRGKPRQRKGKGDAGREERGLL